MAVNFKLSYVLGFIIFLGGLIVVDYNVFFNEFYNTVLTHTIYSPDFKVVDIYEWEEEEYITIEILDQRFIEEFHLRESTLSLKVTEGSVDERVLERITPYAGFSVNISGDRDELRETGCGVVDYDPRKTISYPNCYQYIEITNLSTGY